MHDEGFRLWVVPAAVTAGVLFRWCIGLGSYSGTGMLQNYVHAAAKVPVRFLYKVMARLLCMVIMRHRGIGWS
jgi:hypothetical protein